MAAAPCPTKVGNTRHCPRTSFKCVRRTALHGYLTLPSRAMSEYSFKWSRPESNRGPNKVRGSKGVTSVRC